MKAVVDQDACIGCELCAGIAPEVFEMKDGKAHAKADEVPSDLEPKAKEGAESCPVDAISIE